MKVRLTSSAPHIHSAIGWRQASRDRDAFLLYKSSDGALEVGIRCWQQGTSSFHSERDMLCYFQLGRGVFRRNSGESIEIASGTAVHFKQNWSGVLEALEPIEATYVTCEGGPADTTPVLRDVLATGLLKDWGAVPTRIEDTSQTAGILLSREPNGRAESGIWTCTPSTWRCEVFPTNIVTFWMAPALTRMKAVRASGLSRTR